MQHSIFLPIVGQYDNIGDVVLRRPLVRRLRPLGRLHLYTGPAPEGFVRALDVQPGDVVYRSFGRWYLAGLLAALRGRASYFFKPGEVQLTLLGMKEHLSVLPLLLLMRLRGGAVVRIGSGARNYAALPRALMAPSLALAQFTRWRDARTAAYLGQGGVMPDLAFGDGDPAEPGADRSGRRVLVVSMRGDRPDVSPAWIAGVRAYAQRHGLEIWAVTQVGRDEQRSAMLAAALGGQLLGWDGSAHDAQERRLVDLYRRTAVVVSDRLHVLIAAYTHGAMPVGLLMDGSDKVARHFDAAGITGVTLHARELDADAIAAGIEAIVARGPAVHAALPAARQALDQVLQQALQQVKRSGAVAGAAGSRTV